MKKLAVIAVVALAALAVLILWTNRSGPEAVPTRTALASEAPKPLAIEPPKTVPDPIAPIAPSIERTERAEIASTTDSKPPKEHVRLLVRVQDENSRPLAGVDVKLYTHTDGDGVSYDAPLIDPKWGMHGFETHSDANGAIDFTIPAPAPDGMSMSFEPDPYHDSEYIEFGDQGGRPSKANPKVGDNDLGVLTMPATGAISGRVSDAHGVAIGGATVRLKDSYPGGRLRNADSAVDGSYVLGHVPEGTYEIEVLAAGFLNRSRSGVAFRANATSAGFDFALEVSPTIDGRVRDASGRALAGVRVHGWPGGGNGSGASARTDANGAFHMNLPQDEPYVLEVEHEGYRPWGGMRGKSATVKQGTRDFEIVLEPMAHTHFVVVDAASGVPIETFGLVLHARPSEGQQGTWRQLESPKIETHEHGELELAADPTLHDFLAVAPGYAELSGRVAHEADDRQTIRLVHGGAIAGRVVSSGAPVSKARLRLERASMKIDPTREDEDEFDRMFSDNYRTDLDEAVGRAREFVSGDDGAFRISDLAAGTWKFAIVGPDGASIERAALAVAAGSTVELGDIELRAGGTIDGKVLLAGARSPKGLHVELFDIRETMQSRSRDAEVDPDGNFRFEHVAPGPVSLRVDAVPGMIVGGEPIAVDVASGAPTVAVLDLTSRAACKVVVRATSNGKPIVGALVAATVVGERYAAIRLGKTDEHGEAHGECRSGVDAKFELSTTWDLSIGVAARTTRLEPYGEVEVELPIATGLLHVPLPSGVALPQRGQFQLWFVKRDASDQQSRNRATCLTQFHDGAQVASEISWSDSGADFTDLAAGTYDLTLTVYEEVPADAKFPFARLEPQSVHTGAVEIRAGEKATAVLAMQEKQ